MGRLLDGYRAVRVRHLDALSQSTMKQSPLPPCAIALSAQARIDDFTESFAFRVFVFTLSAIGGYLVCRFLHSGMHMVPGLGASAHDSGAYDALKTLSSGFGS